MKISDVGENTLIEIIQDLISSSESRPDFRRKENLILGIGDDAAVWKTESGLEISTTDTMVQGVHFSFAYSSWYDIGWRAMASNLSDIAAMGGAPLYALINIGLPIDTDVDNVKDLYKGILAVGDKYSVRIVGGDLVKSHIIFITIVIIGASSQNLMLRSEMKSGDVIAVTGSLGSSAAGLRVLSGALTNNSEMHKSIIDTHLRPTPRIIEGQILAENGIRAAMDISDGLVIDLNRLCNSSGVGAIIHTDKIPTDRRLKSDFSGEEILGWALSGGEDYELLFSGPESIVLSVIPMMPAGATIIGEVSGFNVGRVSVLDPENKPIKLNDKGWDHFKL